MGKTDKCMVLMWQGKDRGQQFIYGHCSSAYSILYIMQSWGCLLHTHDNFCITLSFHKLYMYTLSMEGNYFRDSNPLLIAGRAFSQARVTPLIWFTTYCYCYGYWKELPAKQEEKQRRVQNSQRAAKLTSIYTCRGIMRVNKDWLCTYLHLQWMTIFV